MELENTMGVVDAGTGFDDVCGGTAGVVVAYGVGVWMGKVEVWKIIWLVWTVGVVVGTAGG